jgi:hypothetical protein
MTITLRLELSARLIAAAKASGTDSDNLAVTAVKAIAETDDEKIIRILRIVHAAQGSEPGAVN